MLLNKLSIALQPTYEIICGFYLSVFPIVTAIFMINKYLHTLDEKFEAAEKIEQGMISLGKNICGDDTKTSSG